MLCWARYLLIFVVIVLGAISMIGACGRKGPLYLPEEHPQKAQDQAQPQAEEPQTPAPQPTRP
jgi:predicted small lipoprotein YifL